jgi:hypothetical protein
MATSNSPGISTTLTDVTVDDHRMIPRRAANSRPLWRQQGCEAPPCTLADAS